jgi:hypothetical protein
VCSGEGVTCLVPPVGRDMQHISRRELRLKSVGALPFREGGEVGVRQVDTALAVLRVVERVRVAALELVRREEEGALDATHLWSELK